MNKLFRRISTVAMSSLLVFCFSISSSAHSAVTGKLHDASYTGWDIYENSKHWSSYTQNMTIDRGVFTNADFGSYITTAVAA